MKWCNLFFLQPKSTQKEYFTNTDISLGTGKLLKKQLRISVSAPVKDHMLLCNRELEHISSF